MGIHHDFEEKTWLYLRDRCSPLIPTSAATLEILILTPFFRISRIAFSTFASVADTRAKWVA